MNEVDYAKIAEEYAEQHKEQTENALQVQETQHTQISVQPDRNIVEEAQNSALEEIANSEEFKKNSNALYSEKVKADFEEKAIEIKSKALQNEYDAYALTKKKQLLDKRVKYEKNLIKEQVKADVQQQKIANAKRRYGYLTPLLDENGAPIKDENGEIQVDMSKFTPNKASNRFKEWEHNYNNMSKTARKAITTTSKTVIFLGLISLAIWAVVKFVVPFLQSIPTVQ